MAVVIQPSQHTYNGHLLVLLYIWCVYPGTDGEVCNPHQVQSMIHIVHLLCFSENQFEVIFHSHLDLRVHRCLLQDLCLLEKIKQLQLRQTNHVGRFWSNILLRFSEIILAVLKFNFAEISYVPNVLDENLVQRLVNLRICC